MSEKKISELPITENINDDDNIAIVQNNTTKKVKWLHIFNDIKEYVNGKISDLSTTLSELIRNKQDNLTAGTGIEINNDTVSAKYGTVAGTACQGNDSRLSNSRTPTAHASSATTYGVGTTANYGHCKTINNLTSSAYANGEALSAYQGKILNDKIVGISAYSSNGVAGDIALTVDITNARYIDIVYSAWGYYFSKRIYDAKGKIIVLDGMVANSTTNTYNFAYVYTIAAKALTRGNCIYMQRNYTNGNISGDTSADTNVKIHKIVAYF